MAIKFLNEYQRPNIRPVLDLGQNKQHRKVELQQIPIGRHRQGNPRRTQLPQKTKALKAKANERDKLKTPDGVWYVTHDDNDIVYALCTSDEYPERHAYALLQKLQEKIAEISHCEY